MWRTYFDGLCRIDDQSTHRVAVCQKAADALDPAWCPPSITDPKRSMTIYARPSKAGIQICEIGRKNNLPHSTPPAFRYSQSPLCRFPDQGRLQPSGFRGFSHVERDAAENCDSSLPMD